MKKISIIVVMVIGAVLIMSGCKDGKDDGGTTGHTSTPDAVTAESVSMEGQQEITDVSPAGVVSDVENLKPVSLYYMDYANKRAERVPVYATPWNDEDDIAYFGAFASDEEVIEFEDDREKFKELWDAVPTDVDYKIGYEIDITANGISYTVTILEPGDIGKSDLLFAGDVDSEEVTGYVGVWVYDDIAHIGDSFYSHVTQEEYNEDTLLTSIKLRLTPKYAEVTELYLTGFSYSSMDEFDAEGHYCGQYGYTISIVEG